MVVIRWVGGNIFKISFSLVYSLTRLITSIGDWVSPATLYTVMAAKYILFVNRFVFSMSRLRIVWRSESANCKLTSFN